MDYKELKDKIFCFAFNQALGDATRRTGAASTKEAVLGSKARKHVKDYVDAIIRDPKLEGPKPDFYKTAEEVEKCTVNEFTFGNAQKLINMTVKYVFVACYYDEELRGRFALCHCPMDSIMIERVIKKVNEKDNSFQEKVKDIADEHMEADNVSMTWRAYLRQPWSNIGNNDKGRGQYRFFQELVLLLCKTEEISPLEYDFKYWRGEEAKK